ncbi:MAG TPA: aminotransferase class V-fold PLP-dependent enzyme [Candidatus Eisenbacteria bacterium]|nr:aminotransferase class V-fold PLP-dependent enzyme [Candidatus Eisenbacteria bacterium]
MSAKGKASSEGVGARRDAPLAIDSATFRAWGHALVDQLASLLDSIPSRPVTPGETPSGVRTALDLNGPLPEEGMDGGALLEETARKLFDHSLFNGHPRFFGYITAGPAPMGMLGDLLAAAANPNVGGWVLAPAASEIEAQTIRWIGELIGFPAGEGILVSGGNMANIVAFYAARAARADWPVRAKGVSAGPALRVYGSVETHTWIQKAADLSGIGEEAVRWIPVKRDQTMDLDALRSQVDADRAAGDRPFLVVGTAGSVSTGAIDPLPELAAFCRERGLWFHVDGAYGGLAAAVPDAPAALRGLSAADSIAVDPHKWLYAPLEAGCTLIREAGRLRSAFSYRPAYYHLNEEAINFLDLGPQNSRGFRALKVWLMLRQAGASGYRRMIGDDIRLSRRMAEAIARRPDLELVTQVLSIATYRYVPEDLRARSGDEEVARYLDELNLELLEQLQEGGEIFVSNAIVEGRFLLRACIVNFRTEEADVDAVPEITARVGAEVDRAMRSKLRPPAPAV